MNKIIFFLVLAILLLAIGAPIQAQEQTPEVKPGMVYYGQIDPDPGPVPLYAPDSPNWEPGQPIPYSWSNIALYLWWPNSFTARAKDWKCLAKARNLEDLKSYTLEFQDSSIPTSLEHRYMLAIFNFTYLPRDTSRWTLYDGSCFVLNRSGSVMYTAEIGFLPWTVTLEKGHEVFLPSLKGGFHYVIAGNEQE